MLRQKIAYIDLSTGEVRKEAIPEEIRKLYLGGRGIDVCLLFNHIVQGIDPLGPNNVLVVSGGLLTGAPAPASGRCHIGAKSPITGLIGSSNVGGFFAPEFRFAGFDHLVIRGKSAKPVYLHIRDGEIEIRDAAHLWGKDAFETPSIIRKEHKDEDIKALCIGMAGENLVRFANVRTGLQNSAGRTGMGAVMGSKNLKAIAVKGTLGLEVKDPKGALSYHRELISQIMKTRFAERMGKWGTMHIYTGANPIGLMRCRNFQVNQLEHGETLGPEYMEESTLGMATCFGCTVHCRHRYVIKEGPYAGIFGEGPHFALQGSFGTQLECRKIETLLVANHLVNKYGLDAIETGNMIAWAMELYERGIISNKDTGGVNLEWGNEEAIFEMVEMIARRQGFGSILAEGPLRAVKRIGEESRYYMIHVKGLGGLHSDDRATPSFALGVAVATRGADHLRSRPGIDHYDLPQEILQKVYGFLVPSDWTSYEAKGKMIWWHELLYAIVDSLGMCKYQTVFLSHHMPCYEDYSRLIHYITGMEISPSELMEIGERICTLERMFNFREGVARESDYLPERFYLEPTRIGSDAARGKKIDREKFDNMLDEYYEQHGWDKNGVPTQQTLQRLGLDEEPSHLL